MVSRKMAVEVNYSLKGLKKLQGKFAGLEGEVQRKILRAMVGQSATILVRMIKKTVPRRKRYEYYDSKGRDGVVKRRRRFIGLWRTITKKYWSKPRKGLIANVVGAKYPQGAHAHLVEFGHRKVLWGRSTSEYVAGRFFQRRAEKKATVPMHRKQITVFKQRLNQLAERK